MRTIAASRMLYIPIIAIAATAWGEPPERGEAGPPPPPPRDSVFAEAGHGRRGGRMHPVKRYMESLQNESPEEYEHLSDLRKNDSSAFRAELRERLSHARRREFGWNGPKHLRDQTRPGREGGLRRRDEHLRQPRGIKREIAGLLERYKSADENEKELLRSEIRSKLEESFDRSQKQRIERLERLEAELDEMRGMIKQQGEKRDALIDRQLEKLTRNHKTFR